MYTLKGRYTNALITNDEIEEQCITQVSNMINNVAFDNPVVIQVDGHAGKGSTVGFTMPLGKYLVPNTIGVDVGCGCVSVCCGDKLNISLKELDEKIREWVPMGTNINENNKRFGSLPDFSFKNQFPWDKANSVLNKFVLEYNKKFGTNYSVYPFDYRYFIEKCNQIGIKVDRAELSALSCGGGNHFVSASKSETYNNFWVDVHTGSRNFGKCICEYHQRIAQKNIDKKRNVILREKIEDITKSATDRTAVGDLIKKAKIELGLDSDINIRGMEYLEGQEAFNYLVDMVFAQHYAEFNRNEIIKTILEILGGVKERDRIECIHNYIDFRDFIIRKGAISSYIGERMLVPLNMADGILVCEGKSNPTFNYSCAHGAGRKMSKSQAKATLDIEKFRHQMEGIYSTSICHGTLDEAPDSYKNSKMIEEAIQPTATIIDRLIPVLNIKDKNSGPSWKERREKKKKAVARKEERKFKQDNF